MDIARDPPAPFESFGDNAPPRSPLRRAITAARRPPEPACVRALLDEPQLPPGQEANVEALARRLVESLRGRQSGLGREGLVQGLLQEFSLSSDEGVALMCLAEALLRIPDDPTRDALIRDKIGRGDWRAHAGRSASPFVNAAAWGLVVTGRLVATHDETRLAGALVRATSRLGEPVVRKAVDVGMRLMGRQFVAGESIAEALGQARRLEAAGFRYSYDMLGEAAMTAEDAARYLASYEDAIRAIGAVSAGRGVIEGPGISIKLSALHPRYVVAQRERVMAELHPRVLSLAALAREHGIGINIDAEESERLELSLDLLERLCDEPALRAWGGIGFVVQAYQKRAPFVVDYLVDLARRTQRRLMVRLVKGAYWDAEIKRAQVEGLSDYPVYTRKAHTDLCYLACARRLLAAGEAVYPQFATHNAQTLASIYHMAGAWKPGQYEFQCLHGMGEPLYMQVVPPESQGGLGRACRVYAPVGTHETLLAYLVRRLLENGANTSFINRIADPDEPLEELIASPVQLVRRAAAQDGAVGAPHPRIVLPRALFAPLRANSPGVDLTDEATLALIAEPLVASGEIDWRAAPTAAAGAAERGEPVRNPADPRDVVGHCVEARDEHVEASLRRAEGAFAAWSQSPASARAVKLEHAAELLEAEMPRLLGLIVREAGKTLPAAVAEVREAVDFLRYYAHEARAGLDNATHPARGPVVCISPWNFPLAIFVGQVSAALAAGNTVLAKPAEQTPLIAAQAVRILHEAGIARDVVQLLPGRGETVGARLVADGRVRAVAFTGSTEVARAIQRALADRIEADGRPIPLIAETGGQNAMIVDSSALAEQVVADALVSAFDSAGQRCSALRVLCVQEEVAERVLAMLQGAMAQLAVGNPEQLSTDVGPVIDAAARSMLQSHIEGMRTRGHRVHQCAEQARMAEAARGTFVVPTLVEIERLDQLEREVFGPVLHVMRYRRDGLDALVEAINRLGYGLTLGIHSRVDETIDSITRRARVGNAYVNRNMIGAVVGVQPFGGEGLSGTGPKAGGPLYLHRFITRCPADAAIRALRAIDAAACEPANRFGAAFEALAAWAHEQPERSSLARLCDRLRDISPVGVRVALPGPTGERNTYSVLGRERVLCLADDDDVRLAQVAIVLALGGNAVVVGALPAGLPGSFDGSVAAIADWRDPKAAFDVVLHHGDPAQRAGLCREVARRDGPIIGVHAFNHHSDQLHLERLLIERVVSVNTAAAGGNASLMTIG
ncbi:MAG: trifunctional transcriptional regulator/proline dehydrogenase/L-glutamate gamma-semialdehyde dehydrogenase [Betaproteobacteria bacterium]